MSARESIAVVGLGCRYPDALSPGALWDTVIGRRRAFRPVPPQRLSAAYRGADDQVDSTYLARAAVLEGWEFDRRRFSIPQRLFRSADMTHWLALDTAAAALADAGFPDRTGVDRRRVGVVVGNSLTGEFTRTAQLRYRLPFLQQVLAEALDQAGADDDVRARTHTALAERILATFPEPNDETLAGALSNTIAGRVCNYFDLGGGGYTIDGACSSSLLAVITGCRSLAAGETDLVLAGGVDLSLDPFELVGFSRLGALSHGPMRVFDAEPTGFLPGEGCGLLALMRASDARDHGVPVYAEVRGWGVSSDGTGGITRPEIDGQLQALEDAYRSADVDPSVVGLVEGHGTGTPVGDTVEIEALNRLRGRAPAVLGSVKANIGHTKAAAGAASLIKTVLALHRQVLPPATGVRRPHPLLSPDVSGLRLPEGPAAWETPEPWAGVSSFGFGGINCHVVATARHERARVRLPRQEALRAGRPGTELLALSAPDRESLAELLVTVRDRARTWSTAELADVAGTLAAGAPAVGGLRCVLVGENPEQIVLAADEAASRLPDWAAEGPVPVVDEKAGFALGAGRAARVGLLFPGQAAPVRTRLSAWAADLDVPGFTAAEVRDGATDTAQMQPGILRQELAALAWLQRAGVDAVGAVGHSLGEIAALTWAGALDPAAALRLAEGRGAVMSSYGREGTGMVGVRAPVSALADVLGDEVTAACLNGPAQTVVAGPRPALAAFSARARAAGLECTELAVSHAFHNPAMEPATGPLAELLDGVGFEEPGATVVSTVTGRPLAPGTELRELLTRQLVDPVLFTEAVDELAARCDLLVEVGPGSTLTGLVGTWSERPVLSCDAGGKERTAALTLAALAAAGAATVADWRGRRAYRPRQVDQPAAFLSNPCEVLPAGTAAVAAPAVPSPRSAPTPLPSPVPEAGAAGSTDPLTLLRSVLADRLELAAEDLAPDCSPLRDLHVSSLEVRRCVADVCAALGVAAPETTLSLSGATLGEIAEVVAGLPRAGAGAVAPVAAVRPWVAAFEHRWTPWTPPAGPVGEPAVVVELAAADGPAELAGHLAAVLRTTGAVLVRHAGHPAAAGLGRSIAIESGRAVTVLDESGGPAAGQPPVPGAGYLELRTTAGGVERVVSRRRRVVPGTPVELGPGDLLLVTGGAAGVTARCAAELAGRTGCAVVAVGRTPAEDPAVRAAVEALRTGGAEVGYESCDITDPVAVTALVERLASRGTVAGLVHGAAVNVPAPLAEVGERSLAAAWAPKVTGLENLLAVAGSSLRLVVGFGSIIGRFGLAGELDYAVANDAMRVVLEDWAAGHPGCRVRALEWSVWADIGMGLRMDVLDGLRRQGVEPILPAQGVQAFLDLVDEADAPVTSLVTSRFPATATSSVAGPGEELAEAGSRPPAGRFLEAPTVHVPGAELVADTPLTHGDDPYLADHEIGGRGVLPAVLELEAFAQCADALGAPPGPLAFDDLALPAPVDVPADGTTVLRVAALCEDPGDDRGEGWRLDAETRAGDDGFAGRRASATVRPAAQAPARAAVPVPADLDPAQPSPLYGSVLFHSGRFRRIARHDLLSAYRVSAWLHADPRAHWFSSFHDRRLRLGDPGALDAALHALLPAVPQRLALPVACERVEVHRSAEGWLLVEGRERWHGGDEFVFDVELRCPDGELVSSWSGLRLRAVEDRPFPGGLPPALVGPWLTRAALAAGWTEAPELVSVPGCRADGAATGVLEALAGAAVSHTREGRPVTAGAQLSASYSDAGVLAGRSPVPVGVDWQGVGSQDEAGWRAALTGADLELGTGLHGPGGAAADLALVWSAREAVRKATGADGPLTRDGAGPHGSVLLAGGGATVLAAVVEVAGAGPVACALAAGTTA